MVFSRTETVAFQSRAPRARHHRKLTRSLAPPQGSQANAETATETVRILE